MSNIFVAKPLKNASIVTAILLRVDTTKNMPSTHYNIYVCIYIYYIVQKRDANCFCMYIHLSSWVLERKMPLRPKV